MPSTVSFQISPAAAIVVNGPVAPVGVEPLPIFSSQLCQGLSRWTSRPTDTVVEQIVLQFEEMTTAQFLALKNFYCYAAKGAANQFAYTHTDEKIYTARFVGEAGFSGKRKDSGFYQLELRLEVIGQMFDEVLP